ncbi:MAG: YggU family protein [Planctomycetes bacterium]|nr:YggU family protein [Planctomycetota bacterium]
MDSVIIEVKVVPGASRDQIVGRLGEAIKVKVSAPAEGGKANAAVCALLAEKLGVSKRDVQVVSGHTQPHKRIAVRGIKPADIAGLF